MIQAFATVDIFCYHNHMENTPSESEFLNKKYSLEDTKEVSRATALEENEGASPVQAYLDRIERIMNTERPGGKTGADLLEHMISKDFVFDINDEELVTKTAKGLYESEKQIAIERGQGADVENMQMSDEEIVEKYKNVIKEKYDIQKQTLASWLNYLRTSNDYPMWFKYYAVRGLRDMGKFDRDEKRYASRTTDTVASFPERNSESLGFVRKSLELQMEIDGFKIPKDVEQDIVQNTTLDPATEQKIKEKAKPEFQELARQGALKNLRNKKRSEYIQKHKDELVNNFINEYPLDEERKDDLIDEFADRLHTTDFAKLYAFAQVETEGSLDRRSLEGEWVKYDQGSDYTELENALRGKGTGWCTAEGSAKGQLENGDFYVYYTKNEDGVATEPRVAIRMEQGKIGEIRGVDDQQELEPKLVDIAKEKYHDMPGAEKYEQADHDMRLMTEIYNKSFKVDKETEEKTYLNPDLSKEELMFLYEIDRTIQSFGYDPDPRIKEVREKRNADQDMLVIFECTPEQIAHDTTEVNENTKAYIGTWNIDVYQTIKNYPDIKHFYESFPDKKIFMMTLETNSAINSPETALNEMRDVRGMLVPDYGEDLVNKTEFSLKAKEYELVQFTVEQLGFSDGATTDQIYAKADEMGLDLCPAEVGPHLRLQYSGTDWKLIAMEQIIGRDGSPVVFDLGAVGERLELDGGIAKPGYRWRAYFSFVFLSRKIET